MDMIDLGAAQIARSPDVRGWAATRKITGVRVNPSGGIELLFDQPIPESWNWPLPDDLGGIFQFTVWVFVKIAGQWQGAGFVQMWPGRSMTDGSIPPILGGFQFMWGPNGSATGGVFGDYVPQPGDPIGFMVSAGNARDFTIQSSVAERSNTVVVDHWPVGDVGEFTFTDAPQPVPVPTPTPTPVPSDLEGRVARLEQKQKDMWGHIAQIDKRLNNLEKK